MLVTGWLLRPGKLPSTCVHTQLEIWGTMLTRMEVRQEAAVARQSLL